jgi:hypothetical protein
MKGQQLVESLVRHHNGLTRRAREGDRHRSGCRDTDVGATPYGPQTWPEG